jgi:hypothetical protein
VGLSAPRTVRPPASQRYERTLHGAENLRGETHTHSPRYVPLFFRPATTPHADGVRRSSGSACVPCGAEFVHGASARARIQKTSWHLVHDASLAGRRILCVSLWRSLWTTLCMIPGQSSPQSINRGKTGDSPNCQVTNDVQLHGGQGATDLSSVSTGPMTTVIVLNNKFRF